MRWHLLTIILLSLTWLWADEVTTATDSAIDLALSLPNSDTPSTLNKAIEDKSLVSVLGYHDFTHNKKATEMLLPTKAFRQQLQTIKDKGLRVISLKEFLDWKCGSATLPAHSVLITIDDGWRTVYTHAYPILKEFGYPFTLYLYDDFIDTGSRSLSSKMINEMIAYGATIGSHSSSHPYPSKVKSEQVKGPEHYEKFLTREFYDSKIKLEKLFLQPISTYVYPGGFHTPEMYPLAKKFGYQCLFTVHPGMVKKTSPNHILPRFIVLGTHPSSFKRALEFVPVSKEEMRLKALRINTQHPVVPIPGSIITSRLPMVEVDFSKLDNLVPESLVMRIAGFGKVTAKINPKTKKLGSKIRRPF